MLVLGCLYFAIAQATFKASQHRYHLTIVAVDAAGADIPQLTGEGRLVSRLKSGVLLYNPSDSINRNHYVEDEFVMFDPATLPEGTRVTLHLEDRSRQTMRDSVEPSSTLTT
jgi:hypothetical protein